MVIVTASRSLIGPAATGASGCAGLNAPRTAARPRPALKNAAQVPSELTIGAPSGRCGEHSVP